MNAAALLSSLIPGAGQTPGAPLAGVAPAGAAGAETAGAAAAFAQALAGVLAGGNPEAVAADAETPPADGAVPAAPAHGKGKQGHALGHQVRADAKHASSGHKLGWTIAPGQIAKAEGELAVEAANAANAAAGAAVTAAAVTVAADAAGTAAPLEGATAEASDMSQPIVAAAPQPAPPPPAPAPIVAAGPAPSAIDAASDATATGGQAADAPAPIVTPDLEAPVAGEQAAGAPGTEADEPNAPAQNSETQPTGGRTDAPNGKSAAAGERPALTRSTAFAENRPAEAAQQAVSKTKESSGEAPAVPASTGTGQPAQAQVPAWAAAAERIAAGEAVRKTETSKADAKAEKAQAKGKTEAAAPVAGAASADALAAPAAAKASTAPAASTPQGPALKAQVEVVEAAQAEAPQLEVAAAEAALQTEAAEAPPPANPVRGAPETVAHLAAQIVKKLEGRHTRFEIQLDPAGLGSVQVKMEINAQGELSAHMNFERADTAADLRGRAQELQRALEQAGFDLSRGSLSFEHGQREHGQNQAEGRPAHSHGRAFADALRTAEEADLPPGGPIRLQARARMGVDVRI